ncbi:peptidase C1B, bleomycin hydrolase [Meredithblackwellia eburnea MCA 4105]
MARKKQVPHAEHEALSVPRPSSAASSRSDVPHTASRHLSLDFLDSLSASLDRDMSFFQAETFAHHGSTRTNLMSREEEIQDKFVFSHEVSMAGEPITDQKMSGRCWIFAALNTLRVFVARRYNLNEFQLSQAYLLFYDHISKASFNLSLFWARLSDFSMANQQLKRFPPRQSTAIHCLYPSGQQILRDHSSAVHNWGVQDGGCFDWVVALLMEFGIVPREKYTDTWVAENTGDMDDLINTELRTWAVFINDTYRDLIEHQHVSHKEAVKRIRLHKKEMIATVFRTLAAHLGKPPRPHDQFTWEYYDKDNKFQSLTTTPVKFFTSISEGNLQGPSYDIRRSISIVDDPRFHVNVAIESEWGNIVVGSPRKVRYLNVGIEQMKKAAIQQIKLNLPVWFAVDMSRAHSSHAGLMDTNLYNANERFITGSKFLTLSKADRLRIGDSAPDHAMILVGVHLDDDGKPVRWKVENSWGPKGTDKDGFLVMTDKFFDEFVYTMATPIDFLPDHLQTLETRGNVYSRVKVGLSWF